MVPKSLKYKKMSKPVSSVVEDWKVYGVSHGCYGIKVLESGRVSLKELESIKKLLNKRFKKMCKIFINVNVDKFTTSKPLEVRMGKGKGSLKDWVGLVKKGTVIVEFTFEGKLEVGCEKVLKEASLRLSLRSKVIKYNV